MTLLDKNNLMLQFRVKIYSKNGTEFQSFFESIMEKAFSDFQKIKSCGNAGDGGNDGYRKDSGIYYQVYAPNTPSVKQAEAAKKLTRDFEKLKNSWNEISKIKEYYFVFNDKYFGSIQKLEEAISGLEKNNPNIKFDTFLAKDLEKTFFILDKSNILSLGFNIDLTKAIEIAYRYLQKVEIELDRENAKLALKILENSKDIIFSLKDERLELEYELLECRCLQKVEKIEEARKKYKNITRRLPDDPRAFLYLAEIYLNDKDFDKNKELLEKAEKIDNDYWLLKLEKLVRKNHLREKINTANINEQEFPGEPKTKSNFYRFYAFFLEESGSKPKADSFIEKAIHLNPDRFSNYDAKLSITEERIFSENNGIKEIKKELQKLLGEIEKVEVQFLAFGDIGARNKAILNVKKLNVFRIQENHQDFEKLSKETFELALSCYFDQLIDQIVVVLLKSIRLPNDDFQKLLVYLKQSGNKISDGLAKVLISQFNLNNTLLTEGKKFFKEINNQKYLVFINDIEDKNYNNILKFLKEDIQFAVTIANTIKNLPDLRKKIIENLPEDKNIQKEKLLLLLNYDEKEYSQALEILRNLDLSKLNYFECKLALHISQRKQAWDFEIIILEKLLEKEKNEEIIFNLKSQLFNANFNLKKYPEVIKIGEELLEKDFNKNILDKQNKEALLTQTIVACLERGKIDKNEYKNAGKILSKYSLTQPTFEFKAGIETEVYLRNNQPQKALESVIEGAKRKKVFSPEEYAKLFWIFTQIGNLMEFKLESLDKITENTFVKLKNQDSWYFIGNNNELDATKITLKNDKYPLFIDKKIGDKIIFKNKYGSESREESIENILSISKYILWQSVQNFQKLSREERWEGAKMIEVPQKGGTIDTKYLLSFLEDLRKKTEPFFEMYCKNNIPLAMLAVNESGLTNAIGRIQNENRGFINFSTGTTEELENQKDIARKVINNKLAFYLDGTSALVLSETGLFKKIFTYLPNLKIPQSVVNLLISTTGKFRHISGQVGHMGYAQGKIIFSSVEQEKRDLIQANFNKTIKLLESKPKNIKMISLANKVNCFSEQKVPAELCDACILAQKENIPILTEDFLYLKMNELETKKKTPEYFSSIMLLRILYEQDKVSFDEYLNFFGYLSSYRFKFLSLSPDDIEKAVFGDGKIKTISPQNIRKLNLPLTLSEEYGVPFRTSFMVTTKFLLRVLTDNTVIPDIAEKVFIEIIESFPTKMDKKTLGQMFLRVCIQIIEKSKSKLILNVKSKTIQEKIDLLSQYIQIYDSGNLFIP